jgi:hypothetical protein
VQFDLKGNRIGGALLLAVVTLHHKTTGRFYRLPTSKDYAVVYEAQKAVEKQPKGVVPDERLPLMSGTFNVPLYGITAWGDMFTSRQKVALLVWQQLLKALRETHAQDCLLTAMSLALSRVTMCGMSLTNWNAFAEKMQHTFGRQALPMVWDFAEVVSTAHAPGAWQNALDLICEVVSKFPQTPVVGQVQQADACESPLSKGACDVWFTDPPYYFAVPYADLSDFFFVWLKRTLSNHPLLGDPFDKRNPLTPKDRELCQMAHWDSERYAHKDQTFFEDGMARAFAEGRRVLKEDGICCVVFAHKTTEGWEALLSGIIRGGWTITASWPISTEMASRLRARDSAALAGSVHLVCRPRPADASVCDWTEVKAAMEKRIREWLPTLLKHGVRGADAIFSCLGPALESYSKYEKVLTAGDHEVPLGGDPDAIEPEQRGFLAYVFETLSKEALRQILGDAETEGFEEDSRMTALFLWTLQATKANGNGGKKPEVADEAEDDAGDDEDEGKPKKAKAGFSMPFDTFIRITRPMGIHYPTLEHCVIEIEKGIVRLLPVRERSEQLLGEAATRPGIEITLEDVKQLELGLATQRREEAALMSKPKRGQKSNPAPGKSATEVEFTTLDRLHRAMLLFGLGRSTLLRQVLETELRQSKRFERLALALNALYPDGSDERRMLEGVQAAMRGVR